MVRSRSALLQRGVESAKVVGFFLTWLREGKGRIIVLSSPT